MSTTKKANEPQAKRGSRRPRRNGNRAEYEPHCTKMFHVTEAATAQIILAEGFAGGWGDAGFAVYFYDNLPDAVNYAKQGGWDGELERPVVLEACVPFERYQTVEPDPGWPNPEDYVNVRYVPLDDRKDERLDVPREIVWTQEPKRRAKVKSVRRNTRLDESREEAAARLRAANRRCAAALRRIDTKLGAGQKELWDALAEAGSAGEFKRLLAEHKARMDKITPQNAARRERIMLEWEDAISEAIDLRVACAPPMRQNGKRQLPPPEISAAMPSIVKLAQQTYDDWHQDEEGFDEELGEGGICHLIAEEICSVLASQGLDCGSVSAQVGEQHVWAVVKIDGVRDEDGEYDRDDAGVWSIDIPPGVYESGGGYSWRKKPGVAFEAADVVVTHESRDPDDFERFME